MRPRIMTWLAKLARHTIFAPSILVFSQRPECYNEVSTVLQIWICICFWAVMAWLMLQASFRVFNAYLYVAHASNQSFDFWMQPSLRFMSRASWGLLLQLLRDKAIITTASDRWIDIWCFGLFSSVKGELELNLSASRLPRPWVRGVYLYPSFFTSFPIQNHIVPL